MNGITLKFKALITYNLYLRILDMLGIVSKRILQSLNV